MGARDRAHFTFFLSGVYMLTPLHATDYQGPRQEPSFTSLLQAYYGALRHPRQIPLVYPIAREKVRFIRMTQLGWGSHDWSIAEVRVLR